MCVLQRRLHLGTCFGTGSWLRFSPPRLGMARRPAIEGISVVGTQEVKGVARKKDGTRVPDVYTVR